MANIIFTINCVLPVFLVIIIGYILKRTKLMSQNFIDNASKLVFLLFLPSLIFRQISAVEFDKLAGIHKTALIGIIAVTAHFLILSVIVKFFIKDRPSRGAFIQGCFRSNYALIGVPLATNLFGREGAAKCAVMLAVILPFFIVYSVITLSLNAESSEKSDFKNILFKIVKNPYIIAVFSGLLFSLASIHVPDVIGKTLDYMADIATPLALLTIGAFLSTANIKDNFRIALSASLIKTVLVPLLSLPPALFLGLRGADLGVLFILFASPAAVSSFIMAKGMKSNASLAANIVIISTALSCFTFFIGILILKNSGVI